MEMRTSSLLDGLQGLYERFDRALDIRFDDNVEFLISPSLIFSKMLSRVTFWTLLCSSSFARDAADLSDISSLLFIHDKEVVAGFRHAVHAEDLDRDSGWTLHLAAVFIVHRTDAAPALAGQDAVTDMRRVEFLDKDAHDRASAFIQLGFDDDAVCFAVRIHLGFLHFSDEEDVFQKIIRPDLLLQRRSVS